MTPEQVNLVLDGIERMRPRLPQIADAFYAELFDRHPQLRPMFPADLTRQRIKFADELHTLVVALPDLPAFLASAARLGNRHAGYGVRVAHYNQVRTVLITTIAADMGSTWTAEHEQAWTAAYDMITEAMLLNLR
ncbi:globin domain-containing protein [Dactylosporangium sp. NPDC050588]|uniref:globin domain-containing protein n=1 Tax=Dactylosporangium sp. NPDC050588 TaxID=3157211 RepID=UPI0033D1D4E3